MASFSQRKGFKPIRETVQLENMDGSLRNAIWNCFHDYIIQQEGFLDVVRNSFLLRSGEINKFSEIFWANFLKEPVDACPQNPDAFYGELRKRFFRFQWYEVYDFVEFVIAHVNQTANSNMPLTPSWKLKWRHIAWQTAQLLKSPTMPS